MRKTYYGIPNINEIPLRTFLAIENPLRNRCLNYYCGYVLQKTRNIIYVQRIFKESKSRLPLIEVPYNNILGIYETYEDTIKLVNPLFEGIKLQIWKQKNPIPSW